MKKRKKKETSSFASDANEDASASPSFEFRESSKILQKVSDIDAVASD